MKDPTSPAPGGAFVCVLCAVSDGHLKLEAEIRNLSMGQLLAEIAGMAIKKGMIEVILHEPTQERAAPLQPENS